MSRTIGSVETVERCLARVADVEPWLHAFVWIDPQRARRLAREADAAPRHGPLHGIPVAVKDIVDTAGIPTENGSALFRGRVPDRSATIVRRLEDAGAIVIGKTVTAEFAYFHPGPTVNPYDRTRTPGGSSMGSAAAVAAGEAVGAVGTQTNGSVIRPAAFCGVVGFKPSHGRIPADGVLAFAPSLDTVGALAAVMAGDEPAAWHAPSPERPRFAIVRTGDWDRADPLAAARFDDVCETLAEAGASVDAPDALAWLDEAVPLLRAVMAFECVSRIGPIVDRDPSLASEEIKALLAEGRSVPEARYREALDRQRGLAAQYTRWTRDYDALLTLPAAGEAPDLRTTGDPRFCTRWTFIGAPAVTIPVGLSNDGLPLGLQLVGVPGGDRHLLAAVRWASRQLPPPPLPPGIR